MLESLAVVAAVSIVLGVVWVLLAREPDDLPRRDSGDRAWSGDAADSRSSAAPAGDTYPMPEEPTEGPPDPLALAAPLMPLLDTVAHPRDFLASEEVSRAADRLAASPIPATTLRAYAGGGNAMAWYICTEALARRTGAGDMTDLLLDMLPERFGWRGYFTLRALHAQAPATPIIGRVLAPLDFFWTEPPERSWLASSWNGDCSLASRPASPRRSTS